MNISFSDGNEMVFLQPGFEQDETSHRIFHSIPTIPWANEPMVNITEDESLHQAWHSPSTAIQFARLLFVNCA